MTTGSRRDRIIGGVLVVLVSVVIGLVSFIATSRIFRNTDAIQAIQKDRAARIVEACGKRHDAYLSQVATLDLIDSLIHQTDINDVRIPPELRDLAAEVRLKAEASIAEARISAAKADCRAAEPAMKNDHPISGGQP